MITAVLRLLVPTSATIGSTIPTTTTRFKKLFRFFFCLLTIFARKRITASFANSEGWKDSEPKESHLFEPL